jgi:hypothetical protein
LPREEKKNDEDEVLTGNLARIKEFEEELARTKYNKHTQGHIGRVKAKIALLKQAEEKRTSGGAHGYGYGLKKAGDATALMVGLPSVGKSTLLNAITNAQSKTAAYDFTTIDVVPGVLEYNGAHIQVLDLPGLISGASEGKGRGREVLSVARIADLVLITAKASNAEKEIAVIKAELIDANFRVDTKPPQITVQPKSMGGINVGTAFPLKDMTPGTVKEILSEFKYHNADVVIKERGVTVDRLIDALSNNRVYVPSLVVINKIDLEEEKRIRELKKKFPEAVLISAEKGMGIEIMKKRIWEKLGLIRVYLKKAGKEPDMNQPVIMKTGSNILEAAGKIRGDWKKHLEYGRVWGPSARFPGQKLGPEHILMDMDVLEMHM